MHKERTKKDRNFSLIKTFFNLFIAASEPPKVNVVTMKFFNMQYSHTEKDSIWWNNSYGVEMSSNYNQSKYERKKLKIAIFEITA